MSQEFDYREMTANTKVAENALANANSQTITKVLDEINADLRGRSADYRDSFNQQLSERLNTDGLMPQVLMNYTQADYDFLSHGHKRISSKDLNRDAVTLHNEDRFVEESLVKNMNGSLPEIQHAKHEHKFLFFGTKHGVDEKQLRSFKAQADDRAEAENMLANVGIRSQFEQVSGAKGFITKGDVTHALQEDAYSHNLSAGQSEALSYMNDHFKSISKTIDPDSGLRAITEGSMDGYANRRGANYYEMNRRDTLNMTWDRVASTPTLGSAADSQPRPLNGWITADEQ